jgi:alpha-ketoglutarate-dependent taurine dioxygenase
MNEVLTMKEIGNKGGIPKRMVAAERRPVRLVDTDLVRVESPVEESRLPVTMTPAMEGVDLAGWLRNQRELVAKHLAASGGILFRGFPVRRESAFEEVVQALSGELLDYTYRSTPRTQVSGRIYSSTEYPAGEHIPLHNEMSYTSNWPMKIWFFSLKPAAEGGQTPLADSRKVYAGIDAAVRRRFEEKGVMYVRNFGSGLDLPWQEVFQTSDKAEVARFCKASRIDCEWKDEDRLQTRQVCQAAAQHPVTGEQVWFNQAHLFHISSLGAAARQTLAASFTDAELPRNSFYGDGSAIALADLDEVREVYRRESVVFPWHEGDLLLLDNMLAAHGRRPYSGARRLLVGMAEPFAGAA